MNLSYKQAVNSLTIEEKMKLASVIEEAIKSIKEDNNNVTQIITSLCVAVYLFGKGVIIEK